MTERQELVFGSAARETALRRTTAQLEEAEDHLADLQALKKTLSDVRSLLSTVREPNFDPDPLLNHAGEIDQAQSALNQLDLREVNELETHLATARSAMTAAK
jgi:DNA gyrase/topoisomerase IV subunit A